MPSKADQREHGTCHQPDAEACEDGKWSGLFPGSGQDASFTLSYISHREERPIVQHLCLWLVLAGLSGGRGGIRRRKGNIHFPSYRPDLEEKVEKVAVSAARIG